MAYSSIHSSEGVTFDILDDLCSRFIVNVPEEERLDPVRIFFNIEHAHWYYMDFYRQNYPDKTVYGLKDFAYRICLHVPFLNSYAHDFDNIYEQWKTYKSRVPTFGAVILDEDLTHVLLVQSYRLQWGFPKGKINKKEAPYECAIREVYEEIGFDIRNLINPLEYIESNLNKQVVRLYVIPGIKRDMQFSPKTRNEIKAIEWFPISNIPISKKIDVNKDLGMRLKFNKFYAVSLFINKLQDWIYSYQVKSIMNRDIDDKDKNEKSNEDDSPKISTSYQKIVLEDNIQIKKGIDDSPNLQSLDSQISANFPSQGIPNISAFKRVVTSQQSTLKEVAEETKSNGLAVSSTCPVLSTNNGDDAFKCDNLYDQSLPLKFEPIVEIKSWVNFKFDIDSIMKSMDDALKNGKK